MKKRISRLLVALLVLLAIVTVFHGRTSEVGSPKPKLADRPIQAAFDKAKYSIDDPNSLWVVVNKKRPLQPQNYAPGDLVIPELAKRTNDMPIRRVVIADLTDMFKAAETYGTPLRISSAYRSYGYQVGLYNGYVRTQGQAVADTQSARPGYSEHQTGLALDVAPLAGNCDVEACFADTPAGQWLAANAYKYGFIIRYTKDDTPTTGYTYEPWHIRYIGRELAAELQRKNIATLEQFFGLPAAPNY